MWLACLLPVAAMAETLPVALGTQTATVFFPSGKDVALSFRGGGGESGTWRNIESSSLSLRCATEPLVPELDAVEQVILKVGEKKWALAAGSSVAFTCGEGKTVTITDLAKRTIAAYATSLTLTVEGIK